MPEASSFVERRGALWAWALVASLAFLGLAAVLLIRMRERVAFEESRKEREALIQEQTRLLNEATLERNNAVVRIGPMQKDLDEARARAAEYEKRAAKFEGEALHLSSTRKQDLERLQDLNTRLQGAERQVVELRTRTERLTEENQKYRDALAEAKRTVHEAEVRLNEMKRRAEAAEQALTMARDGLKSQDAELKTVRESLKTASEECRVLKERLDAANAELERLRKAQLSPPMPPAPNRP